MITCALLLLLPAVLLAQEECDDATMRRCRRKGLEALEGSRSDDVCSSIRENFDCILWQTSLCLDKQEQDDNRDTILKMWRYLQSFCESEGNWYTKPCFQRDDVKRCEALLPAKGYSTDVASCRSYSSFRDCVMPTVLSECTSTDQKLFGTYLMEKGQQRAWNCPRNGRQFVIPTSASLSADSERMAYGSCSDEFSIEVCRTQFDAEQKEARTRNDSDMKHHKTCCGLVHYEECVRERCGREEARGLVFEMKERFPYLSCEDHTTAECSSASGVLEWPLLILLLTILGAKLGSSPLR